MPKAKKTEKVDGRTVVMKPSMKFRIGPRKSGRSAFGMSTEELNAVLANSDMKRYHNNARVAINSRS